MLPYNTRVLRKFQYLAPRYAEPLLADQPSGLGYLLKDRAGFDLTRMLSPYGSEA